VEGFSHSGISYSELISIGLSSNKPTNAASINNKKFQRIKVRNYNKAGNLNFKAQNSNKSNHANGIKSIKGN
jgi:hypothetical protein